MKTPPIYTYLSEGKYIFTLREVTDRPKEMPQANFKGTGKALVSIRQKDSQNAIEGQQGAEMKPKQHKGRYANEKPCMKWGKEDLSLVGTSTLI